MPKDPDGIEGPVWKAVKVEEGAEEVVEGVEGVEGT